MTNVSSPDEFDLNELNVYPKATYVMLSSEVAEVVLPRTSFRVS